MTLRPRTLAPAFSSHEPRSRLLHNNFYILWSMSTPPSYLHRNGTVTLRHRTVMRPIASETPSPLAPSEGSTSSASEVKDTASSIIAPGLVGESGVAKIPPTGPTDRSNEPPIVCRSTCVGNCTGQLHLTKMTLAPALLTPALLDQSSVNPQQ